MAVKSTYNSAHNTKFPKMMSANTGLIVLFTEPGVGMVIHPDKGGFHSVGTTHGSWAMVDFTDYHGSVTLSSEK